MTKLVMIDHQRGESGTAIWTIATADESYVDFPNADRVNDLFRAVAGRETSRELRLLARHGQGIKVSIPAGLPAWVRTKLCEALEKEVRESAEH